MDYSIIHLNNGTTIPICALRHETNDGFILTLPAEKIPEGAKYIDFCPELLSSPACEDGFILVQTGSDNPGTFLLSMTPRADAEHVAWCNLMPILAFSDGERCILGIVTGMPWACQTVCGVKNNVFYTYQRFEGDRSMIDEDITIEYHLLPAGSRWNDLARYYRGYQLSHGCRTLRERTAERPELRYALESLEVRMRLAWKPVPSPVDEQTPETEPPVHVACTFARVEEAMEAMKNAGVEKAEICLVGWNIGGHDGRWMQHFPAEPKLGGDEGLCKVIEKAHSLGYQIVGHSNLNDSYSIASMWDKNDMAQDQDGSLVSTIYRWGGGKPYQVCPSRYMATVERDYPKMAAMGFHGITYVDVLSHLPPPTCHAEAHPVTTNGSIRYIREVMRRCRELFGGFASEGSLDHSISDLDYAFYVGNWKRGEFSDPLCDTFIPFWEVVYHGIVLYNPYWETVNWPVRNDEACHLKLLELGGRPAAYYYSSFIGDEWQDPDKLRDFVCGTHAEMKKTAENAARMYREYKTVQELQYAFMEDHREVSDGVFETVYSNGTTVRVDYNKNSFAVL